MNRKDSKNRVVAFILKGYPRLSETFIVNEILLLEEMGFRIHIFALRNPGESVIHDSVRQVRAQVTYIPDYFWKHFGAIVGSNLRLWLRRPRVYWQAFRFAAGRSLRRWSSSTIKRFAQAAYLVERRLPGTGVVHLHAHFSHGPTTVAFFASWLTGLNYSFSAHAKDIYLQDDDFLRLKIDKALFAVTCTEYNRQHMLRVAGNSGAVHRAYHGINLTIFSPEQSKISPAQPPVILSVGRFVPKKGFPVLMRALGILKKKGISFRAYVIGGGPQKEELQNLRTELELEENVQIISKLSQRELLNYYQQASVFTLACQIQPDGDRDGIPNVLVEAMALKIPVISTNISGIPELIEHEKSGLLVPEKDPEALASALERVLRNPEWAAWMAEAGRRKVEAEFDARRNIQKIGELLQWALEEAEAKSGTFTPLATGSV